MVGDAAGDQTKTGYTRGGGALQNSLVAWSRVARTFRSRPGVVDKAEEKHNNDEYRQDEKAKSVSRAGTLGTVAVRSEEAR